MRALALVGLLAWAPSAVFAQGNQAVVDRVLGNVPDLVASTVDEELPPGTIAVEVLDASEQPVADQPIRLGIMQQSGGRDSKTCMTDVQGRCTFEELSTDSEHSYRVNAPYDGARYSSTPFRLDPARGQRVRVVRLETTRDSRRVFQVLGRTMIEFRDGRAHITQEARLTNLGDTTYVFPEGGMEVRLPDGFKAFEKPAGPF